MKVARSYLFIPGNVPRMLQHMEVYDADALIIDWEDAIGPNEKDEARHLTHSYIKTHAPQTDIYIRINNDAPFYKDDLHWIKTLDIKGLVFPKSRVDSLTQLLSDLNNPSLTVIALIETPQAFFEIDQIAKIKQVEGLFLGGEDLTSALNATRQASGEALLFARSTLIMAAKAYHKFCIDTPWPGNNEPDFLKDLSIGAALGFDGKAAIHPNQVIPINETFSPSQARIIEAKKILALHKQTGKTRFSMDGQMVDKPIIERALSLVKRAAKYGLIEGEYGDL